MADVTLESTEEIIQLTSVSGASQGDIISAVNAHNLLDTGVHGVGASTVASAADVTASIAAHNALATAHGLTANISAALSGAASPSSTNVFATMADLGTVPLTNDITLWRQTSAAKKICGFDHASFVDDNNFNAGASATGITLIFRGLTVQTWQAWTYGYIDGFWMYVKTQGDPLDVKVKTFYPNTLTNQYDMIAESALLTLPGTGLQYVPLVTPLLIEPGCVPGIWLGPGAAAINRPAISITTSAGPDTRYTLSDVTGSDAFSSEANFYPCLEFVGRPPYLSVTGDSIISGQVVYNDRYDTITVPGPRTAYTSEPANALRTIIGSNLLDYENHGKAGQAFDWVLSTGMVSAVASGAKKILIHCGINDIATSRTWAAVEADLVAIKALLGSGQSLYINEILPDTNFTDGQSDTIRQWNRYLKAWCAANQATLIECHDGMGQTRISTGELDDLVTAYNKGDGVHLSPAGVTALATIMQGYL